MNHRIYFIEGLPGSGKTTLMTAMKERLRREQRAIQVFEECERNDLDLSRCAAITDGQYETLRARIADRYAQYPAKGQALLETLDNVTERADDMAYVFFHSLFGIGELNDVAMGLQRWDVYNGHYPFESFRRMLLQRWQSFFSRAKEGQTTYLCDALLLQSPLFELMGFYDMSFTDILFFLSELAACSESLDPLLIYRYTPDIPVQIRRLCDCRTREGDHWEKGFTLWIEASPYCQKRDYHGFNGICSFLSDRQALEMKLIKALHIPYRFESCVPL